MGDLKCNRTAFSMSHIEVPTMANIVQDAPLITACS